MAALFSNGNKVNGHTGAGEHITSNLDYFTFVTPLDLANTVVNTATALDRVVEIIATRGQPVIMGAISGSGPYTLKFAIEHKGAWNVNGNNAVDTSAADMKAAILAHAPDFSWDSANTSVTLNTLGLT